MTAQAIQPLPLFYRLIITLITMTPSVASAQIHTPTFRETLHAARRERLQTELNRSIPTHHADTFETGLAGGGAAGEALENPEGIARLFLSLRPGLARNPYDNAFIPTVAVDVAFAGVTSGSDLRNLQMEIRFIHMVTDVGSHEGLRDVRAGVGDVSEDWRTTGHYTQLGVDMLGAQITQSQGNQLNWQVTGTFASLFVRSDLRISNGVLLRIRAALDVLSISAGNYIVNQGGPEVESMGWGPAISGAVSLMVGDVYRLTLDQTLRATLFGQCTGGADCGTAGVLSQTELRNEFHILPYFSIFLSGQALLQHQTIDWDGGSRQESSGADLRVTTGALLHF